MKIEKLERNIEVELPGFDFNTVFEKTYKEVKASYYDSPELFITVFIENSPELQALGDKNNWTSTNDVAKEVDKEIRTNRLMVVSEKDLAKLVIKVLSTERKQEDLNKEDKKTIATEKGEVTYNCNEGLFGLEIEYENIMISKDEFEEKIKEKYVSDYELKYDKNKVTVTIKVDLEEDEEEEESDE